MSSPRRYNERYPLNRWCDMIVEEHLPARCAPPAAIDPTIQRLPEQLAAEYRRTGFWSLQEERVQLLAFPEISS